MQDYLDRPAPGATDDHLVVPRSLAQSMPLRWQQVFVGLLADLHDAYAELPWPDYKVVPSRWERLVDLDDEQLQAAGYVTDLDADGHLEYRDAADDPVPDPDRHRVLAPIDDPLPRAAGRPRRTPPRRPSLNRASIKRRGGGSSSRIAVAVGAVVRGARGPSAARSPPG